MPELPEVEYARRQLRPAMEGARIQRVLARRPDLRYPLPASFAARLEGQLVRAIRRRAKYLVVDLASGSHLVMHLGMSGSFRILPQLFEKRRGLDGHRGDDGERHDHIVFVMSSGATVVFNDPRRFGFMTLLEPNELADHAAIGSLGPEPLDRQFTPAHLVAALGRRRLALKPALLDQRVVAGLGNIYACEALHHARLSPTRRASTLIGRNGAPKPEATALITAIRHVLRRAIARNHQNGGPDRFWVYDREGLSCPRRGCGGTIRRIVQAGRSTFWCPICQR